MNTENTILNAIMELKEGVGAIGASIQHDRKTLDHTRDDLKSLSESVEKLSDCVINLADRLKPVEKIAEDYSGTKHSIMRTLALLGLGNLGIGAMGAALFDKWFGGS